MIEIKIDRENNENYLKVKSTPRELSMDFYYLFESFMRDGELKGRFMCAFLAYLSSNNELLNAFKEHANDPEYIQSIDELIKKNKELYE